MKLKKKYDGIDQNTDLNLHEEFFQLPRAERLVKEIKENRTDQIGDLVTNTSLQMTNRFTIRANDNHMNGADIQAGDYMVVEKKNDYPEGCILVVQLGNKQLARRYFRAKRRIHLKCDPPSRQIIIVDKHTPDFQILGQVVQIIREIK